MQKIIRNPIFIFIIVLSSLGLSIYSLFSNSEQVVYVDSSRLLNGYKAMVQAKGEFEKKQTTWQNNVDSLTNEVQEAIKKYEKTIALGSEKEKQIAKDFITSKQKDLYSYQNAIKQNGGIEEQKLTQNVITTINAYLLRYGKKHGYKMILVANNGNIGYADQGLDVTDKIVEGLNNEYGTIVK